MTPKVDSAEKKNIDSESQADAASETSPPQTSGATGKESFEPTEGGWDAWLTVLGTTLISFGTFGMVNGFGGFQDFYKRVYLAEYSPAVVSMIGALSVFTLYLTAGISGAVFDAVGPRYMIPASGLIAVFAMFMLSLTQPGHIYQQFLAQSILFSVGASFSFFPAMALVSHWFKRKLPFAIGPLSAGASVGGIVFPTLLDRLEPRIGFGWTVRVMAFIILFCFLVATFTVKARRPTKPLPRFHKLFDPRAFKEPAYLFLALGSWSSIFAIFNPFFYIGLYGRAAHPGSSINPYYLAILCASSILGRTVPGFIALRVGRFNVLCVSVFICGILTFALWYPSTSERNTIAFTALYGFFSGPFFSLVPACVSQISPVEKVGARIGGIYAFMASATISGAPLTGLFIKHQTVHNFRHMILFSGVVIFFAASLLSVSRFILQRRILAVI